ncbi:MAG: ATP-binding protein [Flavobacteriales bacterium]
MKIRTRLSILFTLLTAGVLLVFSIIVFWSASNNREKEFFTLLEREAITKANLFLNAQVDEEVLQQIYRSNREILYEVEAAIYDENLNLIYHDAVDIDFVKETDDMLREISQNGHLRMYQGKWQVIGIRYMFKDKPYLLTAAAYDEPGYNKLNNLFTTMLLVLLCAMVMITLLGWYFSKKAFEPVKSIVANMQRINATNLDLRLHVENPADELGELAITFNTMLDRLENSFDAQKHFVTNISHELRTPLAAVIAELDLSLNKDRDKEQLLEAMHNVWHDATKLNRLINSMLDLAKASYDPTQIKFSKQRVDEILIDAIHQVQRSNKDFKVEIDFLNSPQYDVPELSIWGNEYLLRVAFSNLIDNACKYSPNHTCLIHIASGQNRLTLQFINQGANLQTDELEQLFKPFYRLAKSQQYNGSGIGLYLSRKIVSLHQGELQVSLLPENHVVFHVVFALHSL